LTPRGPFATAALAVRAIDEARSAIALGTRFGHVAHGVDPAARVAGLAWLPLVGMCVGAAATAVAWPVAGWSPLAAAAAGVVVLDLLGGRSLGPASVVKVAALALVPPGTRWVPLVLAPVLGRWAQTVQSYGGRRPAGEPAGDGRAQFREFGWASVVALGTALALLDAVGLLAGLATALTTVGMRVVFARRWGGMPASGPAATATLVEVVVMGVLAALAPLALSR
jgi:cobalamin synthase